MALHMAGGMAGAAAEVSGEALGLAPVGVVDMGEASVGVALTSPVEAGLVPLTDPTMVARMP